MRLFLISLSGYGCNFKVVRAVDAEDAINRFADSNDTVVMEFEPSGGASVLWEYDYSPDSRP